MADVTVESLDEATSVIRRVVRKLADELADTRKMRRDYAFDIRRQAVSNANRRPTRQARGIATSLRVRGGSVLGFPSTRVTLSGVSKRAAGINYGAEYGSATHSQFAARNESGYWLNPAADQVNDEAGEQYLDDAIDASLRRVG